MELKVVLGKLEQLLEDPVRKGSMAHFVRYMVTVCVNDIFFLYVALSTPLTN